MTTTWTELVYDLNDYLRNAIDVLDDLRALAAKANPKHIPVRTPTAFEVCQTNTSMWRLTRAHGITATDMPTILGIDPYRTLLELVARKVAERHATANQQLVVAGDVSWEDIVASAPNEAAEWGLRLEDEIARAWLHRQNAPALLMGPAGLLVHNDRRWQMCTPDRVVYGCGTADLDELTCLLEVKTRSADQTDRWLLAPPADVAAQVQWQLAVTGLDHAHIACLLGGQRLIEHRIDANPAEQARMVGLAAAVQMAVNTKMGDEDPGWDGSGPGAVR